MNEELIQTPPEFRYNGYEILFFDVSSNQHVKAIYGAFSWRRADRPDIGYQWKDVQKWIKESPCGGTPLGFK